MDRVDFWQLERSVQERFVEATKGGAAPTPLAQEPLGKGSPGLIWIALGVISLLAAGTALRVGFGDLGSRYALAPGWFFAIYASLFALSAFAFLKLAVRHVHAHAVPYRPALYLFPIGVIDARTPRFTVHRVSEQSQISVDGARHCLRIELDGETFEFSTRDLTFAQHAADTLTALRDRLASAGPDSSAREQSLVDPLVDNGFKNPFSPTESMQKALPLWVKAWPVWALVLGVLLGGAALLIRNALSEARLDAAARSADSSAGYRAYLARGGHNPDVPRLLLPRAELRDAQESHTVLAIEHFIRTHPNSPIQPEVDAALQQALAQELAAAEALGSMAALQDFGTRYARYPLVTPDLDRAIETRITLTVEKLRPTLVNAKLAPFFERLLRFTAKHGPDLSVRFQRKPTETLSKAEKALSKNAYFSGEKALPGQYFDAAHAAPREDRAASVIASALAQHFPDDAVRPKAAPTLDASVDLKPAIPSVVISYHTEMSGVFSNKRPRFALSGIGILCKASFEIPGESEPLVFKFSVWRAPDLNSVTNDSTPAEAYEAMAQEAFKRFTKRYLGTLFIEH